MKILLLGKNGQVGWELQRALQPLGEVISLDRSTSLDGSKRKYKKEKSLGRCMAKSFMLYRIAIGLQEEQTNKKKAMEPHKFHRKSRI